MTDSGRLFYGLLPIGSDAPAGAGGNFEAISTVTVTSTFGAANIEFVDIPQGYAHLQIRIVARHMGPGYSTVLNLRFNGNNGTYASHALTGDGTKTNAVAFVNENKINVGEFPGFDEIENVFGVSVIDVLDYASTSKNTTIRAISGKDKNGAVGYVRLDSGMWDNTSAVTSISLPVAGGQKWDKFSTFALYGIGGAA